MWGITYRRCRKQNRANAGATVGAETGDQASAAANTHRDN
jgi:hypothetical protein